MAVTPIGDPGSTEIPSLDACRACAKSFARWVDRGRSRGRAAARPRPPRAEKKKKLSRHSKFQPTREQVALVVVILLGLLFGYYITRG